MFRGVLQPSGGLSMRHIKGNQSASLSWKLRNKIRLSYIKGAFYNMAARKFSAWTSIPTMIAELRAVHIDGKTGVRTDYGVLGRKQITTAFVTFLVDELQVETSEWGDFKFHDSGVGVTGENATDTDIETTDGEARVTGSQTEGASANIYRSVGTITYTSGLAITEHGLFSQATGATLMDRTVFGAINVVSTDQIEFTYEATFPAGS